MIMSSFFSNFLFVLVSSFVWFFLWHEISSYDMRIRMLEVQLSNALCADPMQHELEQHHVEDAMELEESEPTWPPSGVPTMKSGKPQPQTVGSKDLNLPPSHPASKSFKG